MMISRKALLSALFAVLIVPWSGAALAQTYDVLQLPSAKTEVADESLIYAIRQFGDRYFATGVYGHILYSDDAGATWTQADVPVRSSITDIHFPTPEMGWAVGHEGVILHSSDGGKTWEKQYDGLRYGQEGIAYYSELAEQDPNHPWYTYLVDEMQFAIDQGADKPFFKVYFLDEQRGYAVGAYGMVMTTLDGGKTWIHRLETVENESFYHVFDFAPLPGEKKFFLAGEAGLFLVADVSGPYEERHARLVTSVPWEGSFFTSIDTVDGAIVVGGLRGQMFRTTDAGDTWTVVEKPPTSSIVDSVRLPDDRLIFVGMAGEILASTDNGDSFTKLPVTSGDRIYTVAAVGNDTLLVGGPNGIKKVSLSQ